MGEEEEKGASLLLMASRSRNRSRRIAALLLWPSLVVRVTPILVVVVGFGFVIMKGAVIGNRRLRSSTCTAAKSTTGASPSPPLDDAATSSMCSLAMALREVCTPDATVVTTSLHTHTGNIREPSSRPSHHGATPSDTDVGDGVVSIVLKIGVMRGVR